MGLSFRYPATWHRGTWDEVSSFTALIVCLSTGAQISGMLRTVHLAQDG